MTRSRFQFTILELLTVTAVVAAILAPCSAPGPGGRAAMPWCFIAVTVFLVGGGTARIVSGKKRGWLMGTLHAVLWTGLLFTGLLVGVAPILDVFVTRGYDMLWLKFVVLGAYLVACGVGGYRGGKSSACQAR